MDTKYTPGPWNKHGDEIGYKSHHDDQSYGMFVPIGNIFGDNCEANARRIVACVNACSGIQTDLLEALPDFEKAGVQTINQVMLQRDELLAALHDLLADYDNGVTDTESVLLAKCRAAIAKATGKEA